MKKFLFILSLFLCANAYAQPTNYTNINGRYRWIAGVFDSTFTIPKGTTPSLRTGGWNSAGALFYNTSDSSVYMYTGTQWSKINYGYASTLKHEVKLAESINKGQAAYVSGANGTNMLVTKASYDAEATSSKTMG